MDSDMSSRLFKYWERTVSRGEIESRKIVRKASEQAGSSLYLTDQVRVLMYVHGFGNEYVLESPTFVEMKDFRRLAGQYNLAPSHDITALGVKVKPDGRLRKRLGEYATAAFSEQSVKDFLAAMGKDGLLKFSETRYEDAIKDLGYDL